MLKISITAALVALAGSAEAAKVKMPNGQTRHTWYQLSGRSAACEVSAQTPEAFQLALAGVAGHLAGVTAETIAPDETSRGSAGVSFSSGGTYCRISNGATFASGTRAKATQISARVCSIFCESGTVALTTAEPIALRLASSLFLRDAGEFRDGLAPQRSP
jgi:hypothetical protein